MAITYRELLRELEYNSSNLWATFAETDSHDEKIEKCYE